MSRYDEVVEVTEATAERFRREFKCPACTSVRAEWDGRPVPINVDIVQMVRGCIAVTDGIAATLIHKRLYGMLRKYLKDVVCGRVRVATAVDKLSPAPYVTCFVPRRRELEAYRGRYCRHYQCQVCGRLWNDVRWASGGIVERYLDDRLVYFDTDASLYIDASLVDKLRLKERFSDMKLYRVDVIPEPLDGDIMPGDPGWDGVFRRQRTRPEPPRIGPVRGRFTDDGTEDETSKGTVALYVPDEDGCDSLLDYAELERALAEAVRAADAGEIEMIGRHARKRAWMIRFQGPNTIRLCDVVKHGLRRFETRLPEKWHMAVRIGKSRERKIVM